MEYDREDYANLYGDRWQDKRGITWWEWAGIALFAILLSLQWGCDSQAAQATHESVMDAQAKKEQLPPEARVNSRLLSLPVGGTWIEQSGNDGLGKQMKPIRRYTQSADLTRRK